MADLSCSIAGVKSPNPFWLASAPPTDKAYNVNRAFEAGWGGVVWKTLGIDPPIVNTSSRYGALHVNGQQMMGFTNIELITDRLLAVNLAEIRQVKRDWPDRALIVSLMVPCTEADWKFILHQVEDTGADAVELNFGCPHGMSERGMGSAVGQVPEYIEMVTRWVKGNSKLPCFVKLTPNITDIRWAARAAFRGKADAISLINTLNSIIGVNLDAMSPEPIVDGKGGHGGYCGPAVKPIALHMVAEIARDSETPGMTISGIGGIATWRDAAEFIALGAGSVQVCTAAMHYGFRIVQDMIEGLSNWMDTKSYANLADFRGKAVANVTDWQHLNMNYDIKARIDQNLCIKCGLCHIACEDTAHQAITREKNGRRLFEVVDKECVGCNLCLHVCPVPGCITMQRVDDGSYRNWTTHENNPMRVAAEK
jgi:dihydropyrimidine dehydrogenase (NAD+) subunit PreA